MEINEDLFDFEFEVVMIIGNGFDLSLGLKTSYRDFIKSKPFERLINQGNKLAKHLKGIDTLQNWIDIEIELKNYVVKHGDIAFYIEFKNLSSALKSYLESIDYPEVNENSYAVKVFNDIIGKSTLIIDFNYTDTVQKIAKFLNLDINDKHSCYRHVKIHGSLENDDLIFGVEDKADIPTNFVYLKKSVNKHFKPFDLNSQISSVSNLVVFGHSLGETDHMYFDDFFVAATTSYKSDNLKQKKNIYITHYGEESYYKLFEQIDKLTKKRITRLKTINNVEFWNLE